MHQPPLKPYPVTPATAAAAIAAAAAAANKPPVSISLVNTQSAYSDTLYKNKTKCTAGCLILCPCIQTFFTL